MATKEMKGWSETLIEKGVVFENSKVAHTITYSGERKIRMIKSPCKCIKFHKRGDDYTFYFTTKPVPANYEDYDTTKFVVIMYHDDSRDLITIKAKVKRNTNED